MTSSSSGLVSRHLPSLSLVLGDQEPSLSDPSLPCPLLWLLHPPDHLAPSCHPKLSFSVGNSGGGRRTLGCLRGGIQATCPARVSYSLGRQGKGSGQCFNVRNSFLEEVALQVI